MKGSHQRDAPEADTGRTILSLLIPSRYKKPLRVSILKWAILGLIIRFVFMPFTMHLDLLDIYVHPHWMLAHQHFNPLQPATPHWELIALSPLLFFLIVPFFWIAEVAFPGLHAVYESELSLPYSPFSPIESRWVTMVYLIQKNLGTQIFPVLFILKIPYLIADFMVALLFLRMVEDESRAAFAFKFWMVNPVTIYSTFIWGDFSVLPVLCVVLSLYLIQKRKLFKSFISLGIGTALKIFPFLLTIPHAILLTRGKVGETRRFLTLVFLGLAPYALTTVPFILTGDPNALVRATVTGPPTFEYFTSLRLLVTNPMQMEFWIMPYVVVYCLLILKSSSELDERGTPPDEGVPTRIWRTDAAILISALALSFFHPQYFLWASPFIVMLVAHDRSLLKLHVIQIIGWFFYTFNFGRAAAMWLFAPASTLFLSWPSPREVIWPFYDPWYVINIARSFFSAISLWMVYKIVRKGF